MLNGRRKSPSWPAAARSSPGGTGSRPRNCSALRSPRRCSARRCCRTTTRYTTGGIGILGTLPSQETMEQCDALLIVGSTFPYIEYYPKPGQARCVQIDRDAQRIGLRCPVEAGLVGDAARLAARC